ncbi:MAG: arsenical pump-driving ATPase [Candidatus Melainabacteria bacterium]|nr:arsenical pump-driving ATPase [Candidatus Melainabacteria bacterium]
MDLIEQATRYMFFTGKGGVGKTSVSCAIAIALADRGKQVLLVSTDPASNLDEVLQVQIGQIPTAIPTVNGLFALNIDPEAAACAYRERLVGPYRNLLPEATVKSMEEQLSGSCTTEIAAFDEFAKLIGNSEVTAQFDHVIFDTAPTGHTMRLLSLPESWSTFIKENTTGMSCLGPLSGLSQQQEIYVSAVQSLKDPIRTTLVLVARPEKTALREAAKTSADLRDIGVSNQCLVVNGVFKAQSSSDEIATAFEARANSAMSAIPPELSSLPLQKVFLSPNALIGIEALRGVFREAKMSSAAPSPAVSAKDLPQALGKLVDELEKSGPGVIMTMGKGGVGKTSVAAAVAVELARRGHNVHLSTTDPAAHVSWVIEAPIPLLTVSRIDPEEETKAYQEEVMQGAGAGLDEHGKALLEEDLRSPCTEEVAVFRSFAKIVAQGEHGFVVLDTAPTGHTILLLDAAQAYHREVLRQSSNMPESVLMLLPRLRDPNFTHVLIVTLPEATPVHEAKRLQDDLMRAGITPFAWVINQSLSLVTTKDPVLLSRRANELKYIEEVSQHLAKRVAIVPWLKKPPTGSIGLLTMLAETNQLAPLKK